jgi:hypothetical protein
MPFFDNVDLGCGHPKKRHLAQFPIATEAAAAKLQTRKAHSHAALIGGSSRFIPSFINVENVNKAICRTIPNFLPVLWVGSMVQTIIIWVYDCFDDLLSLGSDAPT